MRETCSEPKYRLPSVVRTALRRMVLLLLAEPMASCSLGPVGVHVDQSLIEELPAGAGWHYLKNLSPPLLGSRTRYTCAFNDDGETISSIDNTGGGRTNWRVPKSKVYLMAANEIGLFVTLNRRDVKMHGWDTACVVTMVDDWPSDRAKKKLTDIFSAAKSAGIGLSCNNVGC